ncbi:MAG: hypothetical protein SF053_08530 [Bacteroidia bacterium]|nr:hypothetical protein [Bacteroidia bacterium]
MTPSLRKRHRYIWLVWAILLPILVVIAWLTIPTPAYQDTLYPSAATSPQP